MTRHLFAFVHPHCGPCLIFYIILIWGWFLKHSNFVKLLSPARKCLPVRATLYATMHHSLRHFSLSPIPQCHNSRSGLQQQAAIFNKPTCKHNVQTNTTSKHTKKHKFDNECCNSPEAKNAKAKPQQFQCGSKPIPGHPCCNLGGKYRGLTRAAGNSNPIEAKQHQYWTDATTWAPVTLERLCCNHRQDFIYAKMVVQTIILYIFTQRIYGCCRFLGSDISYQGWGQVKFIFLGHVTQTLNCSLSRSQGMFLFLCCKNLKSFIAEKCAFKMVSVIAKKLRDNRNHQGIAFVSQLYLDRF